MSQKIANDIAQLKQALALLTKRIEALESTSDKYALKRKAKNNGEIQTTQ